MSDTPDQPDRGVLPRSNTDIPMPKVVSLAGRAIEGAAEPVPGVVEFCEELLVDARSGRLRAVATAEVRGVQGAIAHGFAHGCYTDNQLAGAILLLGHAFARRKFDAS